MFGYNNNDQLTKIATPTTTYNFTYGDFGLRTNIKVGSTVLASYDYADNNDTGKPLHALLKLDYGNGDSVQYTYDDHGRVTKQTYEDGDTVTYQYDNSGALATVTDSATGVKTTYYYDFADRMMKYVESGTNYSHSVGYAYDEINNLTSLVETINGVKHTTSYTYDNDNRVTSVTNGSASETYTYDGYSRVSQKVTKNGTATVLTESFTYHTYEAIDPETEQMTTYASSQVEGLSITASGLNRTYTYAYDNNGNILSVSDGTNTTSYVYDSAGQLLRENNQAAGKTWVWTYDNAGNIKTRKEYAYTTGTLGTVVDTVTYNYDNTNWGDLLISYDGRTINYDKIGNPLNDGRWTYTWEHGRQLASITDGNTTVDYVYNSDGLRTQKTVTTSNSHTHVFQNTVVAPTCTENGHTRHVCSCGYIYQDTPVAATGHTYTTSVVADTCTTNGYTLYTCSCGYSYQDGAPGHTFTTLVVAPTETVNGFTKHECECGYSYQSAPVASLASGASSGESGTTEVAVYDYVYNGSSLTQLTVTSGEDDAETLYFAYDGSSPMAVTYGGATYYYATNLQGDVIAILNSSGTAVVQYTYDAWGNILTTTGSMASTLGAVNPLTYRGYVFDRETGLYYLQSRYYNPEVGRFINADAFPSTGQGVLGNNMFAYCGNNPTSRTEIGGFFWDTVLDVASLCFSIAEVIQNPDDPMAWLGVVADVASLVIPCVSGGGALVRAATKADDVIDAVKAIDNVDDVSDVARIATTGSPNTIGQIGEQLAGIDPNAKVYIQVNGRTRIPDALTETTLTEVKNVKYISNTRQLRDFADFAQATGRTMDLYVRPTTKVAQTVIDAGWNIQYLW